MNRHSSHQVAWNHINSAPNSSLLFDFIHTTHRGKQRTIFSVHAVSPWLSTACPKTSINGSRWSVLPCLSPCAPGASITISLGDALGQKCTRVGPFWTCWVRICSLAASPGGVCRGSTSMSHVPATCALWLPDFISGPWPMRLSRGLTLPLHRCWYVKAGIPNPPT